MFVVRRQDEVTGAHLNRHYEYRSSEDLQKAIILLSNWTVSAERSWLMNGDHFKEISREGDLFIKKYLLHISSSGANTQVQFQIFRLESLPED